jgi:hypothetical protein
LRAISSIVWYSWPSSGGANTPEARNRHECNLSERGEGDRAIGLSSVFFRMNQTIEQGR